MTYYLGFCLLILGIVELIYAIKNDELTVFIKKAAVIISAVVLGIGANSSRIMAMKEYADFSTRGKSELTINADRTEKKQTTGLDKSYITEYSYAKLETFNLFIPRYMGGGTFEELSEDSNFYKLIEKRAGKKVADDYSKQVLTYWGDQTIIEAPAYIGAVIFFLFFLGIFLVKGKLKQWLVAATIFSILLSWGRNFDVITNFFIDYIPLYNKFRAVSSIQVIAELCVPILAILALRDLFSKEINNVKKRKVLEKAVFTFGGVIVLGFLLAHVFSTFEGIRDNNYKDLVGLIDAVIADRKAMLLSDTIRSLVLVILTGGILWLFLKDKLKKNLVIVGLGVLVLFDLISVDKRYVNQEDFTNSRRVDKPFVASNVDKQILQDTTHFRVGNFVGNPMQDGTTSYFHQSIGGYHAAKMGRYSELFEYQIAKNNMQVLNMLNTKYLIVADNKGEKQAQLNPYANGNAWFVNEIKLVDSANKEMMALDSLQTKFEAVIDNRQLDQTINLTFDKDSTATISLKKYDVTELTYESKTNRKQFAVFSEIFYKDGWNAYVDGQLTPHYRVNYVLRGMIVPEGNHTITFKFEPKVIQKGGLISLISYIILILVSAGWLLYDEKKKKIVA